MNSFKEYINLSVERLKSETPKYFKKTIKYGMVIGGLGVSIILAGGLVPAFIHAAAGYMVTVGIVSAYVAKTATCDSELTKKSEELLKTTKEDATPV